MVIDVRQCNAQHELPTSNVNSSSPNYANAFQDNRSDSQLNFDTNSCGLGCGINGDDSCVGCQSDENELFKNLHFFGGIDGAKQPQDYGVNANLGMRLHFNWGIPVVPEYGIGFQIGAATEWSGNAVRVYELLGLNDERTQNYITFGAFQRTESGFGWAIVYDNLYQESFDHVHLSQWRGRLSWQIDETSEVGATVNLRGFDDTAQFGASTVRLRSIDQGSIYYRHTFESGVEGTVWLGVAGEHGESNAAFGPATPKQKSFIYGADFFAPLNEYLAIYGETNLMMPADTGTVDAYLGVAWYPYGGAKKARKSRFAPMLPVAADTSFSVDLLP